jgi:hypothetical protein
MEQTVQITLDGVKRDVIIREITWREKTDCIKKSIKEVQKGRQLKKEVDNILQKELMLLKSMDKSNPALPSDFFEKLSSKDGEKVYSAYSKLNDLDDEEGEA